MAGLRDGVALVLEGDSNTGVIAEEEDEEVASHEVMVAGPRVEVALVLEGDSSAVVMAEEEDEEVA